MKKYILHTVFFLGFFLLLFVAFTFLFIPKDNSPQAGIYDVSTKAFIAEPQNTMDVFFVGDSKAGSSFIPLYLWRDYGITSYVSSTGNQPTYQTYTFVKRFFQYHAPKIVVIEANCLFQEYTFTDILSHTTEEYLPFLRYHNRWKNLHLRDLNPSILQTYQYTSKGYSLQTDIIAADATDYMTFTTDVEPVPILSQWCVQLIRDLCEEHGAEMILVHTPSTLNCDYKRHNSVSQLAEQLGIHYIDMNLIPEEVPIDWDNDTYDKGNHLNYYGAQKVTTYMGAYFQSTSLFTDKRNLPQFAQWDEALYDFNAQLAD